MFGIFVGFVFLLTLDLRELIEVPFLISCSRLLQRQIEERIHDICNKLVLACKLSQFWLSLSSYCVLLPTKGGISSSM